MEKAVNFLSLMSQWQDHRSPVATIATEQICSKISR